MGNKKVVIIVSNYNGATALYRGKSILFHCLSSLKKTTYENYSVILADDKSTDNSTKYVKKNFPEVDVVTNNNNGGFSKNNNNAIVYAIKRYNPKYILLLNNDIIINQRDWLTRLIDTIAADKKAGIEGCRLVYPNGRIQHAGLSIGDTVPLLPPYNKLSGVVDSEIYDKVSYTSGVTGAAMLISKDVISSIGLLDENFYMGHEDVDYCLRATNAGFKIIYNGMVKLTHLEGFTSTHSADPSTRLKMFYYFVRNFVYFRRKYSSRYRLNDFIKSQLLLLGYAFFEYKSPRLKLSNIRLHNNEIAYVINFIKGYVDGLKIKIVV
jgi:GT2 family glycosyltransferase